MSDPRLSSDPLPARRRKSHGSVRMELVAERAGVSTITVSRVLEPPRQGRRRHARARLGGDRGDRLYPESDRGRARLQPYPRRRHHRADDHQLDFRRHAAGHDRRAARAVLSAAGRHQRLFAQGRDGTGVRLSRPAALGPGADRPHPRPAHLGSAQARRSPGGRDLEHRAQVDRHARWDSPTRSPPSK